MAKPETIRVVFEEIKAQLPTSIMSEDGKTVIIGDVELDLDAVIDALLRWLD